MQDTIRTYQGGNWTTVDGIVEPVYNETAPVPSVPVAAKKPAVPTRREAPVKKEYNIPPLLMRREFSPLPGRRANYVELIDGSDSTAVTLPADTIGEAERARLQAVADSIAREQAGERLIPIVIENPAAEDMAAPAPAGGGEEGMSWIYFLLAVLFVAVALRFKTAGRQIRQMAADLTDVRTRHNVFDDTVREKSFKVLMNVLWAASAGVLLWTSLPLVTGDVGVGNSSFKEPPQAVGIAVCMGIAAVYLCGMYAAYWVTGNIFTDTRQTALWVRGATSCSALESFLLFPAALLALFYPDHLTVLLIVAAATFIIGKLIFILKGFRIFFSQIASLLLFLYYLCSLEIVPIVLVYVSARVLTSLV